MKTLSYRLFIKCDISRPVLLASLFLATVLLGCSADGAADDGQNTPLTTAKRAEYCHKLCDFVARCETPASKCLSQCEKDSKLYASGSVDQYLQCVKDFDEKLQACTADQHNCVGKIKRRDIDHDLGWACDVSHGGPGSMQVDCFDTNLKRAGKSRLYLKDTVAALIACYDGPCKDILSCQSGVIPNANWLPGGGCQ